MPTIAWFYGIAIQMYVLAAIALESIRDCERCPQPSRGEIVADDFASGFEKLEVVPRFADPEHHNSFERRTARQAAGDFRYEDCSIRRKREALARPLPQPSQFLVVCGALLQRSNLGGRRHHAQSIKNATSWQGNES